MAASEGTPWQPAEKRFAPAPGQAQPPRTTSSSSSSSSSSSLSSSFSSSSFSTSSSSFGIANDEILNKLMEPFRGVSVKDRRWRLRTYKKCFVASEGVDWLLAAGLFPRAVTRQEAEELLECFREARWIEHVVDKEKPFSDDLLFFEFTAEGRRAAAAVRRSLQEGLAANTLEEVAGALRHPATGVEVKDRTWRLKTYRACFVASELVDWLVHNLRLRSRGDAVEFANRLVGCGAIRHVAIAQPVKDAYLFFAFAGEGSFHSQEARPADISDFTTVRVLGVGGFGKVVLARKNDTKRFYAIKALKKAQLVGEKELRNMESELEILKNDHTFLVHLHWSFQSPSHIYLIMDYLPGGDLFFHLQKYKGGFPKDVVRLFVAEIILALEYLHACGIVYRDLKLENILLDADGHVCLTDFGLSKPLGDADRTETMCGTPGYLAPEILSGRPYSTSVDFWSLGVLMFEISSGLNPFLAENTHKTLQNILHKPILLPDSLFDRNTKSFLQLLLVRDPSQRLCSPDLMKDHPYFKGLDFQKLLVKKIKSPFVVVVTSSADTSNFDAHFTTQPIDLDLASPSDLTPASSQEKFAGFDYRAPDAQLH
ncbi:MAG: protein kinase [archaeon]|nr:protein kinase [archaeon]